MKESEVNKKGKPSEKGGEGESERKKESEKFKKKKRRKEKANTIRSKAKTGREKL